MKEQRSSLREGVGSATMHLNVRVKLIRSMGKINKLASALRVNGIRVCRWLMFKRSRPKWCGPKCPSQRRCHGCTECLITTCSWITSLKGCRVWWHLLTQGGGLIRGHWKMVIWWQLQQKKTDLKIDRDLSENTMRPKKLSHSQCTLRNGRILVMTKCIGAIMVSILKLTVKVMSGPIIQIFMATTTQKKSNLSWSSECAVDFT